MVETGHGGVQGDDAQPVDEVAVVHGGVVGRLVQEPGAEIRPVIVVPHRPDDLGTHGLAGGLDDRAQFVVGAGFAAVGQVSCEDHCFGARAGSLHFLKELLEQGIAVHRAKQGLRTGQQVGVTQME